MILLKSNKTLERKTLYIGNYMCEDVILLSINSYFCSSFYERKACSKKS